MQVKKTTDCGMVDRAYAEGRLQKVEGGHTLQKVGWYTVPAQKVDYTRWMILLVVYASKEVDFRRWDGTLHYAWRWTTKGRMVSM